MVRPWGPAQDHKKLLPKPAAKTHKRGSARPAGTCAEPPSHTSPSRGYGRNGLILLKASPAEKFPSSSRGVIHDQGFAGYEKESSDLFLPRYKPEETDPMPKRPCQRHKFNQHLLGIYFIHTTRLLTQPYARSNVPLYKQISISTSHSGAPVP